MEGGYCVQFKSANDVNCHIKQGSSTLFVCKEWPERQSAETMSKFERSENESNGGEGGIRTLETLSGLHAFQACALGHYATSPKL